MDANELATQICGCATPQQRKSDIAALLAFRGAAVSEALTTAQAQAAAQEQRIADALAWLRDHIKEVDDDNSYWGGPHKRAYLDAPAILKELTTRVALPEKTT